MSPLNKRGPKRRIKPLQCPYCGQTDCVICENSKKQKFRCKHCKKIYNHRTKTIYAWKKTAEQVINLCIMLFSMGVGISVISYATKISEDTLARWKTEASKYCKNVHDKYVRDIRCEFIQFDELWSFVKSKINQQWIWSAIDVKSKLLIAFIVAPRLSEYACKIVSEVASRVANCVSLITTDGYKPYTAPITEFFPNAMYAQVIKKKKKGRLVEVLKKAISGHTIDLIEFNIRLSNLGKKVNTAFIERLNLTMRRLTSCLSRKTNCFSKDKDALEDSGYIFAVLYNFIRPHMSLKIRKGDKTIKRTPAMAANITDRILSWSDVLRERPLISAKCM